MSGNPRPPIIRPSQNGFTTTLTTTDCIGVKDFMVNRGRRKNYTIFAALIFALMLGASTLNLNSWRAQANDQSLIEMPKLERLLPPTETDSKVESDSPQIANGFAVAMMAAFTVDRVTDNNPAGGGEGTGTIGDLRYCMTQANIGGGSNTIDFSLAGTINLAGELPLINNNLTINGLGANLTTVRRNSGGDYRIFTINFNRSVSISGLTMTKGRVFSSPNFGGGGGIFVNPGATLNLSDSVVTDNEGYSFGGGILSYGALNINNCTISFNKAGNGGGFYILFTTATITNSTINNNMTDFQAGVGNQDANVTLTNCTVSNNTAAVSSAGIVSRAAFATATTNVTNCTVANNNGPGAALAVANLQGAMGASLTVKNTLAASNGQVNYFKGANNSVLTSLGHNLDTDGTSGFINGQNGDLIGSAGSPIDAKLAPLAANGGPTQTRALMCGSPAIDAGDNNGAPVADQRGVARPQNNITDIGAYESKLLCLGDLANGKAGIPYNETLSVVGGQAPFSFSLVQGNLPPGLTLNPTTGQISGTVAFPGTWNFIIQVTNAQGFVGMRSYTLVITCPTIVFNPATLPGGAVGVAYNQTVSATPATGQYSFAVTGGALPAGLNLNGATGAITGTPTLAGTYNFVLQATGFSTCTSVMTYSILIGGNQCPAITLSDLPNGNVAQLYANSVTASPAGSYNYAVSVGNLPPGLTLYGSGLVFGFPTTPGTYNFTITATDVGNCNGSKSYSMVISQ
jgi:hypothetical protein